MSSKPLTKSLPQDAAARRAIFRDAVDVALGDVDAVMAAAHLSPPTMALPHIDVQPTLTKDNTVEVQVVRVMEVPDASVSQVSAALWRLIHHQLSQLVHYDPMAQSTVLEEVDADTLYTRYQCQFGPDQPRIESKSICHRRTLSADATTIVYRCFMDDAAFPTAANHVRHDEHGSLVVYCNPATKVTTVKMVSFLRPLADPAHPPAEGVADEFLHHLRASADVAMRILRQNIHDASA
ncbi:Aste57867_18803 [Aphanomyces stellatus]|uniref:Aste57867_18803 protein n=1 Tax=Aphanomyces stellatus TaxID=120398 RepID=A0A485LCI7_9STRA|nr:hypothetical protein As57867_018739 [Aphanomyces stellatus]VFT95537.1 Aste57867_18803 [Aphanomyces stellatus]